ncbi:hypothetical protein ACQ46_gp009 [Citrobacter phage Moon]|uniref:Uncharacterized protein n=1 Tax=Citrobacter phage Moon TaxID=1540095 RepID=A0A0A0YV67_9CAUD|nr:hypothetical protein ACQ46_gp009 [Citrobacter phage Moon]AIX11980.1 hypothetical protein CPT_Moon9 [Citrobacter phage Moon]
MNPKARNFTIKPGETKIIKLADGRVFKIKKAVK